MDQIFFLIISDKMGNIFFEIKSLVPFQLAYYRRSYLLWFNKHPQYNINKDTYLSYSTNSYGCYSESQ
jgi:hypothetical protein